MNGRRLLISACSLALVAPATAAASTVVPTGPVIAGNSSGMMAAAWTEGDYSSPVGQQRVVVSVRDRGGSWSSPVTVSDPHVQALAPRLAVDDRGDVFVAWSIRETYPMGKASDS